MAKKTKSSQKERLFKEKLVPAKSGSGELFDVSFGDDESGPVECLGKTFDNDQARREYFLGKLCEKLKDPEFRKIEGFPNGEDEDILAMSDPPYYTACPNPFLDTFITESASHPATTDDYHREPFSIDVSEGKSGGLYSAHSYHTKVPPNAIVRAILHYTEPGDVVLDGFSGSGMTGVAAQLCGHPPSDFRDVVEHEWKDSHAHSPSWGARRVILSDLSPAATFISANYCLPFDVAEFLSKTRQLLDTLLDNFGWMYETTDPQSKDTCQIDFTVNSEVFHCPECANEIVFLEEAFDPVTQQVHKTFPCPHCNASLTKNNLQRLRQSRFDSALQRPVECWRQQPVFLSYPHGGSRHKKALDPADTSLMQRLSDLPFPATFPTDRMMHAPDESDCWGDKWRSGTASFTHVHHLFCTRAATVLAHLWDTARQEKDRRMRNMLIYFVEQAHSSLSLLNRFRPRGYSQVNQYLSGVYYVASQQAECSPWYVLEGKRKRLGKVFSLGFARRNYVCVSTGSTTALPVSDHSIDYVFTDPPFGDNLAYAELNFVAESFHRVFTNTSQEAIVSRHQGKTLHNYQELMYRCFCEYWRVLKPGRWMTVVFHNSRNSVWMAIQEALQRARFVVADVRVLDKRQGSFNQVVAAGSVKQDLVISCYKPHSDLEKQFEIVGGSEQGVWDFVSEHLSQLPVFVRKMERVEAIAERQDFLLFDRMIAFHVQRGIAVPLSAAEFYAGLRERFPERDGMYFLSEQIPEYDRKRLTAKEVEQLQLFVSDEASAIKWVKQQLGTKPQSFQELQPQFMREISGWEKHEKTLELSHVLDQNFLCCAGEGEVPSQIHSYLSSNFHELRKLDKDDPKLIAKARNRWYVPDPRKEADLEKIRHRALMKEFEEYRQSKGKLKVVRTEALRAGFRESWQNDDYETIVELAKRLRESIIQEDAALLMYYDNAVMRTEE